MTLENEIARHSVPLCGRILISLFAVLCIGWATPANADDIQRILSMPNTQMIGSDIAALQEGFVSCGDDVIMRHQDGGVVAWTSLVDGFEVDRILPLESGDMLAAGRHWNGKAWRLAVAGLDADGNLLWMRGYKFGKYGVTGLARLNETTVILTANKLLYQGINVPLVLRIALNGEPLWMRSLQDSQGEELQIKTLAIGEFDDPGQARIFIGGRIIGDSEDSSDALVSVMNDAGSVTSAFRYGVPNSYEDVRGLHVDEQGDLFAIGRYKRESEEDFAETHVAKMKPNLSLEFVDVIPAFAVRGIQWMPERGVFGMVGKSYSEGLPGPGVSLSAYAPDDRSMKWSLWYDLDSGVELNAVIEQGEVIRAVGGISAIELGDREPRYVLESIEDGKPGCNSQVDFLEANPIKGLSSEVLDIIEGTADTFESIETFSNRYDVISDDPCDECNCTTVNVGLAAYWPLDSTDETGGFRDGVFGTQGGLVGDAEIVEGMVGNGLRLYGNGYAKMVAHPLQEMSSDPNSTYIPGYLEFDAWIRLDEDVEYAPIISKVTPDGRGYRFYVTEGRLGLTLDNGVDREFFETDPVVVANEYTHVSFMLVYIKGADDKDVLMFVNGKAVYAENSEIPWTFETPGESFYLGIDPLPKDGEIRYFRGVLDEPALYLAPALNVISYRQSLIFEAGSCGRCRFHVSTPAFMRHELGVGSSQAPGLLRNLAPHPLQLNTESLEVLPDTQACASGLPGNEIELQEASEDGIRVMAPFESVELAFESTSKPEFDSPTVSEFRFRVEDLLSGHSNDASIAEGEFFASAKTSVYMLDFNQSNILDYSEGELIELRPGRNHRIDLEVVNPAFPPVEVGPVFGYISRDDLQIATSMRLNGRFTTGQEIIPDFILLPEQSRTVSLVVSCDRYLGVGHDVVSLLLFYFANECDDLSFLEVVHFRILPEVSADCEADINADGEVNGADLAMILSGWSTDDGLADLDRNGEVGSADLGLLLARWGVCEN